MCIFSQPVGQVGATRIFASDLGGGVHALAYQMSFVADAPVAMILPVPVLKGTGDDALTFVDLGGYPRFFDDLSMCFPEPVSAGRGGYGEAAVAPSALLLVHEVGDYVASYVPSLADFGRLDPRFRLPDAAWETLPDYHDFGFAVFQLRPDGRARKVHPIAYRYSAERPDELFFPTVHVHDGTRAAPSAEFDHDLYAQPAESFRSGPRGPEWAQGTYLPGRYVNAANSQGFVRPETPLHRAKLYGEYPNADIVLVQKPGETTAEARPARAGAEHGANLSWSAFQAKRKQSWIGRY